MGRKMKIKLHLSHVLVLASALGLWTVPANALYIATVTPDQFNFQTWGGNILSDTTGAYPGDTAAGYKYTNNYGASPSATIIIPLPAGMPSGWNQYDIYEWVPNVHSGGQYHVVDIAGNGTMTNSPSEPWVGQFGTNHQYLQTNQSNQGGWVELGAGPQSDSTNDGGKGVWMSPNSGDPGGGYPYLQIHYLGFENTPESFDAFRIVPVGTPVPEPGTLALLAAGGAAVLLLVRRRRRA
jgi:hypothetical protein